MAGERYVVELEFKRLNDGGIGDLGAKAKKLESGFEGFKKGWRGFSDSVAPVGAAVDSVVGKVANLAKYAVLGGGAAMFAGAVYGVTGLNNELEKTQISLGAIFAANGVASNVPAGVKMAEGLIKQMRRDAQTLPGEFEDLQRIFTTSAVPAFNSGASVDQLRNLSAKVMAAGKVASLDMHMVAREFAQLLGGRSGSHNVLGATLMGLHGKEAQAFNALSSDKRLAHIEKELDKYQGAVTAFGDSFDAQSSTLVDNLKNFGRIGTSSLFIHVKDTMKEANDWFTAHQAEAASFASLWGSRLVSAFEAGKSVVTEYGPLLLNFVDQTYVKFTKVWVDVQPYVQKFDAALKSALSDPNGTIDKLIELAKLWAGLKIGGALVGGMANGGGIKGGMMSAGGALATYGLAHTAASGFSPASQIETMGGGAIAGYGMGGHWGAAGGAILGGLASLYQGSQQLADAEEAYRERIAQKAEDAMVSERRWLAAHGFSSEEAAQWMAAHAQRTQNAAREVDDATGLMVGSLYNAAANIESASYAMLNRVDKRDADIGSFWGNMLQMRTGYSAATQSAEKKAEHHKSKGGGGGTVQKVEIVVTSNQHPNRIARAVVGVIREQARTPTSSPHVTNFSALEES